MNPNDLKEMMKRAQEMQSKVGNLQKDLETRRFEGASGGGMVKATVSGALRVLSIEIEDLVADGGDKAMLQDLVAAAVNNALEKAQKGAAEEMARVQQTMLSGLGS